MDRVVEPVVDIHLSQVAMRLCAGGANRLQVILVHERLHSRGIFANVFGRHPDQFRIATRKMIN